MSVISELVCKKGDSETLSEFYTYIKETYPFVRIVKIGESLYKAPIYSYSLGSGKKVLYVGAHHSLETITSSLLMLFADRLFSAYAKGIPFSHTDLSIALLLRSVVIIPSVNPDGADIVAGRKVPSCPCADTSRWQANARGVDLNHNYPAGFQEYKPIEKEKGILPGPTRYSGDSPLSESETRAMASLIERGRDKIACILTLHTQGEVIYAGNSPSGKILSGARRLSMLSGYPVEKPEGSACYGGLSDYALSLSIPSYTIECGRGENPLPQNKVYSIYASLEKMLLGGITLF